VIVLDSSAALDYLLSLGPGEWVESQLEVVDRAHAPHVIDVEVLGGLRKHVQDGRITADRAEGALRHFRRLRIRRYPHRPLLGDMWELRHNLTASDAAFVALAAALRVPLVTTDLRLARAPRLEIEIRTP
jgi:predicted nucleic acid-binding protein